MNLPQGFGFTLFLVGIVTYLCYKCLEGGFAPNQGENAHTNITPKSIVLAVASFGAGMFLLGPVAGIAIVLGIAIHEFGHVAAFRSIGHNDARFRLIPFLGGVAISNKLPKNQLSEFYIAIMGPGIMLVPLVITGVFIHTIGPAYPFLNQAASTMFIITGAINFFNLLPLWPLDGGRIVRSVTFGLSPQLSQVLTLTMSGGLVLWALYAQQPLIFIVSILGFSAARRAGAQAKKQAPMSGSQAMAAAVAYAAAMWAFWIAGRPLIEQLIFRTL